jgi:glucan phosphoethanolaminetransferase (alkaline phosphatase superfamily)
MFLVSFYYVRFITSLLIAQTDATADGFKELGNMFLWGMLGAIGLALVAAFVWIKIQSKREASSDYVSINPSRHGNQE